MNLYNFISQFDCSFFILSHFVKCSLINLFHLLLLKIIGLVKLVMYVKKRVLIVELHSEDS